MIAIGQSSGRCEGDQREVDGGGGDGHGGGGKGKCDSYQ